MKTCRGKRACALLLAGGMALGFSVSAFAAEKGWDWHQDEKGWWYGSAGPAGSSAYSKSEWEWIDGEWYFFDESGYRKTGWVDWNGASYYLNPENGAMLHDGQFTVDGISFTFDSSGAADRTWSFKNPVAIPPEEEKSETHKAMDAMCDHILAQITHEGMSEREKATAIYYWIRNNTSYSGRSATRDWVEEAYQGFRRHHGDCYTYFAMAQALLTRAGLPSIEVVRSTDADHFWNLTMVDGAWYHFDTTPRSWGGSYCLLTDGEMDALSRAHRNCFAFDRSLYPRTP